MSVLFVSIVSSMKDACDGWGYSGRGMAGKLGSGGFGGGSCGLVFAGSGVSLGHVGWYLWSALLWSYRCRENRDHWSGARKCVMVANAV